MKNHKAICVNGKHLYWVGKQKNLEFNFVFDNGIEIAEVSPSTYCLDDGTPWPNRCVYCRQYPIGYQLIIHRFLKQHELDAIKKVFKILGFKYVDKSAVEFEDGAREIEIAFESPKDFAKFPYPNLGSGKLEPRCGRAVSGIIQDKKKGSRQKKEGK